MAPIDDPRPFADVLTDFVERHGLSHYAAAKVLGVRQGITISRWLAGAIVAYEIGVRAVMTLVDEGRAPPR